MCVHVCMWGEDAQNISTETTNSFLSMYVYIYIT